MKLPTIIPIINSCVERKGGKLYLVGGFVRDYLLGKPLPHDIDIVVENLTPSQLKECLPKDAVFVGKSFPVFKLQREGFEIDITLTRIERKTGKGHKGFEVTHVGVPIWVDAKRRDFTINAIYMTLGGQVIDPVGGVKDLKEKILRPVSNKTFIEDPLRYFRAFRYKYTLGFKFSKELSTIIKIASPSEIQSLPEDRVIGEFKRVFEEAPIKYFKYILDLDSYLLLKKYLGDDYKYINPQNYSGKNKNLNNTDFPTAHSVLFASDQLYKRIKLTNQLPYKIERLMYFKKTRNLVMKWVEVRDTYLKGLDNYCSGMYNTIRILRKTKGLDKMLGILYCNQLYEFWSYTNKVFGLLEQEAFKNLGITRKDFVDETIRREFENMVIGLCHYKRNKLYKDFHKI